MIRLCPCGLSPVITFLQPSCNQSPSVTHTQSPVAWRVSQTQQCSLSKPMCGPGSLEVTRPAGAQSPAALGSWLKACSPLHIPSGAWPVASPQKSQTGSSLVRHRTFPLPGDGPTPFPTRSKPRHPPSGICEKNLQPTSPLKLKDGILSLLHQEQEGTSPLSLPPFLEFPATASRQELQLKTRHEMRKR